MPQSRVLVRHNVRVHTYENELTDQLAIDFQITGSSSKQRPLTPFLKWAGGKKQLLPELLKHIPHAFDKYLEPFVGGGAVFFHLRPSSSILSDSNEELMNTYTVVRDNVDSLIQELGNYSNEEKFYYLVRELDPSDLNAVQRAARTIYLNKSCYNGLYRVNKSGKFNVPFGRRKNALICDESKLRLASVALRGVELVCDDYKAVLRRYAKPGDFVYLDPPYYPAGGYADFKRYTKEFFYEEDHFELRDEFDRLVKLGCHVLLTNSNTELVRQLYDGHEYRVIETRRNISCDASRRTGEDVIVIGASPVGYAKKTPSFTVREGKLLQYFPGTRYMGSKYRVLNFILESVKDLKFKSVLDAFSGSVCVSYMFKQYGKKVISNDFLRFSYHFSKALIENPSTKLDQRDLDILLHGNGKSGRFISETFKGLYFTSKENEFLDSVRANVELLSNPYKKSLALAAISRACMKRRPRGIFTFIGDRYDDGRRDMRIDLRAHFLENVEAFNAAVFDNGRENIALNLDVFQIPTGADLVYLDPPYLTPKSDNDYTRRYHFVEGLVRNWEGLEIQTHTQTKKFKSYDTPFVARDRVFDAFERLFDKFKESIIVLSYSSNSIPTKTDLVKMLKRNKREIRVFQIDHTYSFGNQGHKVGNSSNRVKEYVFVAL
jgi:DNA adenine methylase